MCCGKQSVDFASLTRLCRFRMHSDACYDRLLDILRAEHVLMSMSNSALQSFTLVPLRVTSVGVSRVCNEKLKQLHITREIHEREKSSHPDGSDVKLFQLLLHVPPRIMIPFVAAQGGHAQRRCLRFLLLSPRRLYLLAHLVESLLEHVAELDGCEHRDIPSEPRRNRERRERYTHKHAQTCKHANTQKHTHNQTHGGKQHQNYINK